MSSQPAILVRSQPEHNFDKKQAGMYNLNDMPGPLQERGLFAPLASQGSTLSRKDADRAKPNQAGIHPDQQQTSVKTVSDMFEPIETWDDKETKRVGRSLRRHVERVFIHLFGSELNQPDKQDIIFWMKQGGTVVYKNFRSQSITSNISACPSPVLSLPPWSHWSFSKDGLSPF